MRTPDDIRKLSDMMDSKFGAGSLRFGWDGLIGLIPGLGDLVTNVASMYIIIRAAALGCPPSVLLRMGGNVLVDNLIDFIPIIGNIFDFFWRSNNKNIRILEDYLQDPRRTVRSSRIVVWLTVLLLLTMSVLFLVGAYYFFKWLLAMLPGFFPEAGWDT